MTQRMDLQEMSGRTILITGATGLIGSCLIKALIKQNEMEKLDIRILALIRSREKAEAVFGEAYHSGAVKFIGGGGGATP